MIASHAAGALSLMSKNFAQATGSPAQFDFRGSLDGWRTEAGEWTIEDVADAATGRALVQRATNNAFNVIVAPGGPYLDAAPGGRGMSASPPIASELWHRSEMTRGAMNGLMHRSKRPIGLQ